MRLTSTSLTSIACVLIAACGAGGERSSGATVTRLDDSTIDTTALTEQIEALTRAANVHGLTVTIFNDAEKVYSHAFGFADKPAGKPLRTDTEIYGASLSKALFSVFVMKLVEQGVLRPGQAAAGVRQGSALAEPSQLRERVARGPERSARRRALPIPPRGWACS